MLHTFHFSPANTTRKYASVITEAFGIDSEIIDLTHEVKEAWQEFKDGDTVILLSPVYAGRLPALAADRFRMIKGKGMKAIVAVVYGNRDYDDALAELADIAAECGFEVTAAGAFLARHCIFPRVANGRPDADDIKAAEDFIRKAKTAPALDISKIKGNRPYTKTIGVPLHPQTVTSDCKSCGICVEECPTGAIDPATLNTDKDKCISCCRCIALCGNNARKFKGIMYSAVNKLFCAQNSERRNPEIFLDSSAIN